MGEAQDRWDAIRGRMKQQMQNAGGSDPNSTAQDMQKALYDLANDLTYPMDPEGNQVNIHWLIPMLSFHLSRCGYRKVEEKAVIKQIPHPGRGKPGIVDDAVLFVPVDASGVIPEMYQRTPEDVPEVSMDPWKVKTHITYDGNTVKGGPR